MKGEFISQAAIMHRHFCSTQSAATASALKAQPVGQNSKQAKKYLAILSKLLIVHGASFLSMHHFINQPAGFFFFIQSQQILSFGHTEDPKS